MPSTTETTTPDAVTGRGIYFQTTVPLPDTSTQVIPDGFTDPILDVAIGLGTTYHKPEATIFNTFARLTAMSPDGRREMINATAGLDDVQKVLPGTAPLLALSGATTDGVPTYFEGDVWFWLCCAWKDVRDAGPQYGCVVPRDATHRDELLQRNLRITKGEVVGLTVSLKRDHPTDIVARYRAFRAWIGNRRPQWRAEAEAGLALLNQLRTNPDLARIAPATPSTPPATTPDRPARPRTH